jgi:predicted DNA-binding transcriptional regulator AlpA
MKYLRFPDLKARGIVQSRMTLKRLIDDQGFPPGVLLTPNARAWTEAEVNEWLGSRPVARKPATNTAARSDSSQGRAA